MNELILSRGCDKIIKRLKIHRIITEYYIGR